MDKYVFDKNKVHLHNILYAITVGNENNITSTKYILLKDMPKTKSNNYVFCESSTLSELGWDDHLWIAFELTAEELINLLNNAPKELSYGIEKIQEFLSEYDCLFKNVWKENKDENI